MERPQELGGGGRNTSGSGGGVVRIVAERVQIDGTIQAHGSKSNQGGAGGSVWLTTGELAGSGSIEVNGADSNGDGAGGGGAIAIEYTSLDPSATVLDQLSAHGGLSPNRPERDGGAGTVFLYGPTSTLGSLLVDNGTTTAKRTILPSLGQGIVQDGSSGGTILTDRDADVPAYLVGHWLEVEGPDRFLKGAWRIARVSGTTIELEPKEGEPFTIASGDRWRGIYRFDDVTVADGAVLVSEDPVVQIVPPLPAASVAGQRLAERSGYESLYGNDEAPAWDRSGVRIDAGSLPGSYRIVLSPTAVSDPDGISTVRLTSGGRSLVADWTASGATFPWPGFPGQQLHLVATDAHNRFQRAGWLELPALPDGGWSQQLALPAGATPRAVAGDADWLALGDEGAWLYDAAGQLQLSVAPARPDEQVEAMAGTGTDVLIATAERLDVLDRTDQSLVELPVTDGRLLDVAAGAGEATLLLADDSDPAQPALRLAEALLPDGAVPEISAPGALALPLLDGPRLGRTDGYLHLFGLQDGHGVIYSWATATPGDVLTATPQVWDWKPTWRDVGSWDQGAIVLEAAAVRLLQFGAAGWSEVSRLDLPSAPLSATAAGGRLVVVLDGSIQVYDLADPAAPMLTATFPGSSYRRVSPLTDGEVVLWAPPLGTPPLRWNPASAVPGDGFHTVIDGLP